VHANRVVLQRPVEFDGEALGQTENKITQLVTHEKARRVKRGIRELHKAQKIDFPGRIYSRMVFSTRGYTKLGEGPAFFSEL